jgi:formate/nitrite transporter FocA (FNT family)
MIGFSTLVEAILHVHLPDAPWRPLVENLGYCVGFLFVILSRHQLFTENTVTVILPLAVHRTFGHFLSVARLWVLVAAANVLGALIFAAFWTFAEVADGTTLDAMRDIGRHTMELSWYSMFTRSIVAGILIASLVWIMPTAESAKFWSIILVTYVIAIADLPHIVAGGVEALLLLLAGEISLADFVIHFGLPVFFGNVLGGTGLFSLISYAQVQQELHGKSKLG